MYKRQWLYDEVYEYFIGRRPALDPLGILNDTVGDITGYELPNLVELGVGAVTGDMPSFETEKKNAYDTVTETLGDVAEELPFIGGVLGGVGFWALWDLNKMPKYMKLRFQVLFDHTLDVQNTGWQQTRSLLTLGGGRIFGQGLFRGTQTQSEAASSLPHRHTDFIFSVIGEELGLVGCLLTLALLTAIILRCLYVARHAKTRLEGYACIGVASVIIFQVIINVGMCLFVMPVIGLTLPFISYGGSSLVMLFACMGLVSGVHGRAKPDWLR